MKRLKYIVILLGGLVASSCEKDFLEKKPDKSLVVPTSLADFQALLDHEAIMNITPPLGVLGADEYYLTPDRWFALPAIDKNSYTWQKDVFQGESVTEWDVCYQQIFYSNVVLEGLEKNPPDAANLGEWNRLKGSALFYRANAVFQLLQIFAGPYGNGMGLGIPLKRSPDINEKVKRASLSDCYFQLLDDLDQARKLLPTKVPYLTRPSKPAVFSLLARVNLSMRNYELAGSNADSALAINAALMDFNTLDPSKTRPVPANNPEIIFSNLHIQRSFLSRAIRDSLLYLSYNINDLRRSIYFNSAGNFRGSYTGSASYFSGLATDELYLVRAEAAARSGRTADAMKDLNALLLTRWKKGTFVPLTASSSDEALDLILLERKKELFFRGMRWTDLRRLNSESGKETTLYRKIDSETYILPPSDSRYIYPIPANEISGTGIEQNPR